LFESVDRPTAARRVRAAGAIPLAALLLSQLYAAIYPLMSAVPAWLVYAVGLLLAAGGVGGATVIVARFAAAREDRDAAVWIWTASGLLFAAACIWLSSAIFFPWL
jgi:hypothetical protein